MNRIFYLVATLLTVFLAQSPVLYGQISEKEAIEQLEALGGRVTAIAANTDDREVSLYLAGEDVTDQHVALLKEIANIKWLNLASTSVTDQGLEDLAEIPLTRLHLEKTAVGDAGLIHLKDQKELVYLNLYGSKVTNKGLEHLSGLTNLRKLYVWQTSVDQTGIEWLQGKLPELEVIGEVKLDAQPKPESEEGKKAGEEEKAAGKSP